MLQTSFTSRTRAPDGTSLFILDRIGRGVLGPGIWTLMGYVVAPKWVWTEMAWARAVKASPRRAIEAHARLRKGQGEDVDVEAAMGAFQRALATSERTTHRDGAPREPIVPPKPTGFRRIPARLGVRCGAPGCGDKIKPYEGDTMLEVTYEDGRQVFVEEGCLDWFFNGHPDFGGGVGEIVLT